MLSLKRLWQAEFTRSAGIEWVSASGPEGSRPEPPKQVRPAGPLLGC